MLPSQSISGGSTLGACLCSVSMWLRTSLLAESPFLEYAIAVLAFKLPQQRAAATISLSWAYITLKVYFALFLDSDRVAFLGALILFDHQSNLPTSPTHVDINDHSYSSFQTSCQRFQQQSQTHIMSYINDNARLTAYLAVFGRGGATSQPANGQLPLQTCVSLVRDYLFLEVVPAFFDWQCPYWAENLIRAFRTFVRVSAVDEMCRAVVGQTIHEVETAALRRMDALKRMGRQRAGVLRDEYTKMDALQWELAWMRLIGNY
ncbi:MAG: hypothetical protein Q9159_000649 [Coniocarpon cinnabarinum]